MNQREHAKSQCHRGDLRCRVNRQDYVSDPIDQGDDRKPIQIWVVPCGLRCKGFKCPRKSRDMREASAPYMLCAKSCPFENCRMAMMMNTAAIVGMMTFPTQFARFSIP